jgi:hypothetical protein
MLPPPELSPRPPPRRRSPRRRYPPRCSMPSPCFAPPSRPDVYPRGPFYAASFTPRARARAHASLARIVSPGGLRHHKPPSRSSRSSPAHWSANISRISGRSLEHKHRFYQRPPGRDYPPAAREPPAAPDARANALPPCAGRSAPTLTSPAQARTALTRSSCPSWIYPSSVSASSPRCWRPAPR